MIIVITRGEKPVTSGFCVISQFPTYIPINYHLHTCSCAKDLCYFVYEFVPLPKMPRSYQSEHLFIQIRKPGEIKLFMQTNKYGDQGLGISVIKLWALIL